MHVKVSARNMLISYHFLKLKIPFTHRIHVQIQVLIRSQWNSTFYETLVIQSTCICKSKADWNTVDPDPL